MKTEQIDRLNAERIATLIPEVADLCREHLTLCESNGIRLLVVQALRSIDKQTQLYAQGRTAPGKIVTNAKPGTSWHNYGRAYDIVVMERGLPDWKSNKYNKVGAIGTSIGLVWGGNFRSIKGDVGHFEYHPGLTIAQIRKLSGLE